MECVLPHHSVKSSMPFYVGKPCTCSNQVVAGSCLSPGAMLPYAMLHELSATRSSSHFGKERHTAAELLKCKVELSACYISRAPPSLGPLIRSGE